MAGKKTYFSENVNHEKREPKAQQQADLEVLKEEFFARGGKVTKIESMQSTEFSAPFGYREEIANSGIMTEELLAKKRARARGVKSRYGL